MKNYIIAIVFLGFSSLLLAQNTGAEIVPWHHKYSTVSTGTNGIDLIRAYEYMNSKKKIQKTVIVAIIDSGVDTTHEDLKDRLWHNPNEIPYNNIDDDKNGYVDDYYGWNFIGGKDGKNIDGETLEVIRFYRDNKEKYENCKPSKLSKIEKKEYKMWKSAKAEIDLKIKSYEKNLKRGKDLKSAYIKSEDILKRALKKDIITISDVKSFKPKSDNQQRAKGLLVFMDSVGISKKNIDANVEYFEKIINTKYNLQYDPRSEIVGDNPDDINDTIYGNNDVMSITSSHGTGVSGIIGAVRNNNIGTCGIVDSVKLMTLRVVPGGDERDKDVALAIRYAVNNGASIINCSFGKSYGKYPEFVQSAIDYAIAHDVLIVHAAGNDANNNDKENRFPSPLEYQRSHWIDVGASSESKDKELVAGFSNYGAKSVDVFAPGVQIYSTSPNSKYRSTDGTSNASPVVAGVAALIKAYYPELTAPEIKEILMKSSTYFGDIKVVKPGTSKKSIKFSKLCVSSGVVNAYNALLLAEEIVSIK